MKFLSKNWKWIALIVLVLIVVFVIYKRKQAAAGGNRAANTPAYRGTWTVGRFDHKVGQEVAVTLKERPEMGSVVAGDTIVIENAGPYSGQFIVTKPWQDGGGKLGALFINVPGSENLPDTTREYAYDGVGIINLV